jgi:hypothetical protein
MKIREKPFGETRLRYSLTLPLCVLAWLILMGLCAEICLAVSTKIFRHDSFTQFQKGKTKDVVISSKGTIQLGLSNETIVDKFDTDVSGLQPWSINCIAVNGSAVYFGTSPNGGIYSYSMGKLNKIYPREISPFQQARPAKDGSDVKPDSSQKDTLPAGEPNNAPKTDRAGEPNEYLTNEHIFAMGIDISGHLLAAVSGKNCRLLRLKGDKMETVFEPNDAKYIFAVTLDKKGDIYLGTGPEGKIYRLDSFAKNPQVVYHARDKNILSLAVGDDGLVYAGSDERGLVYKINPRTKTASVLYDSDQPEITALLLTKKGVLYAAATSAQVVSRQGRFAASAQGGQMAGWPEPAGGGQQKSAEQNADEPVRKLQIANMRKDIDEKKAQQPPAVPRGVRPAVASAVYKIMPAGFVTEQFTETAVFFCMTQQADKLLVGAGNEAQLFSVDIDSEQKAVSFEDKQASQITAVAASGDDVYLGTANPAKLIKVNKTFAKEGTYTSDLIDAGQPANWGKLQIDADIPTGCLVKVSARSGNVKDVNDPGFNSWSEPVEITEPVQLSCPVGRFCQYQLTLKCDDGARTPVIREVAVAATVPNLAPKVESVNVGRIEAPGKEGVFKVDYKAGDENGDKLVYKIDLRRLGTEVWIELEDQTEQPFFEWDGRTVEDGRYEIRVTASDEKSNTTATKLSNSRISEPVIVDNTAPVIEKSDVQIDKKDITIKLTVVDQLSVVGKVSYTIDSNADWIVSLPDDLVYDTTREDFTILIKDLKAGEHIIALKISDDVGNTMYKSFDIKIAEK